MRRLLLLVLTLSFTHLVSAQLVGDKENGLASYYSKQFDGAETKYGVIYHSNELVAAHRIYPLNSVVQVENMENGKTVEVRIIDQGPFIPGRIIQLSERAAANLGMIGRTTVQVELTLRSTPDQPVRPVTAAAEQVTPLEEAQIIEETTTPSPELPAPDQADRQPELPSTSPAPAAAPTTTPPVIRTPAPTPTVSAAAAEVKATPVSQQAAVREAIFGPGIYKIALLKPTGGNHGVQVGSFKDLEGAMAKVTELQSKWFDNILLERVSTGPASVYKIILGPFQTADSAKNYASDLKKRYKIPGFAVTLE